MAFFTTEILTCFVRVSGRGTFVQNQEIMNDLLGPEEFYHELLDRVSKKIVSRNYIKHHQEFVEALVFDLFQSHLNGYDLNSLAEIAESVFYNLFHFRPGTENLEEIIEI